MGGLIEWIELKNKVKMTIKESIKYWHEVYWLERNSFGKVVFIIDLPLCIIFIGILKLDMFFDFLDLITTNKKDKSDG